MTEAETTPPAAAEAPAAATAAETPAPDETPAPAPAPAAAEPTPAEATTETTKTTETKEETTPTNGEGEKKEDTTTPAVATDTTPAPKEGEAEEEAKPATATTTTPAKPTKPKAKPKDYGPIITTYEDMDVLSGRGAAVNNHPGNKKFRALCFVRKAHFDLGNHAAKRKLATEIVNILQSGKDHPPSRFLKRRPANALPPADGSEVPAAATNTPLYYAMTKEEAILKAQQVMRDYKRPDRIEAKALQQQAQQARYLPNSEGGGDEAAAAATTPLPKPHRARAVPSTPLEGVVDMLDAPNVEKDDLFQSNPFGVHAHDVLSGRGAYVNGHVGNARLRKYALERKTQFDAGNYTEKRQLANEIVSMIKSLDPPGRFLKKASAELLAAHEKAKTTTTTETSTKEEKKEDETKEEEESKKKEEETKTEESKETTTTTAPPAADAAAATATPEASGLPPLIDDIWEELSDEKSIHKACQVMRDISRPDRKYREERKEERAKIKRNNKRRKLNTGGRVSLATNEEATGETKKDDAAAAAKEETSAEDVVDKALLDSSASAPAAEAAAAAPAPSTSVEV